MSGVCACSVRSNAAPGVIPAVPESVALALSIAKAPRAIVARPFATRASTVAVRIATRPAVPSRTLAFATATRFGYAPRIVALASA